MHDEVSRPTRRWWPPARNVTLVDRRSALVVLVLGAALFAVAALVVGLRWSGIDTRAYVTLNQVPSGVAKVLTPLSRLFLPLGIAVAAVVGGAYCVVRTKSPWPLAICGGAAALAWIADHVVKAVAERARPFEVVAGAVLRQQPPHGSSFPSSHTAVIFAVTIAVLSYIPRRGVPIVLAYAILVGWSRVYLGVHYPLDVVAGAGLGMVVGAAALLVARRVHGERSVIKSSPPPT
jgi:membrane-associated phospholipid phosphatase